MPWWGILLIVIVVIVVVVLGLLMFFGRKLQKRQAESERQMEMMKQTASILVIDKKKLKMKDSGLPEVVIQQSPAYARRMKLPIVKAKIGPKVMTLVADAQVFDILPVKKTCTVTLSGIYITELKSVRGGVVPKIPEKKGFFAKLRKKAEKVVKEGK